MANKITAIQKRRYEIKLAEHKADLAEAVERIEIAQGYGDFSENSELDAAKDAFARHRTKIREIEDILQNSEVCSESIGDIIDVDSLIELYTLKDDGSEEYRGLFMMDSVEDILGGIIGEKSPLGQQIKGNISGIYTVQTSFKSVRYRVIKQPSSRSKDFIDLYDNTGKLFE